MAEDAGQITGNAALDRDLAILLKFAENVDQVNAAREAIADESLPLDQLQAAIPQSMFSIILALLDTDQANNILGAASDGKGREVVQHAISFVSKHLKGLDRHPAIVAQMRRALVRQAESREDGENTITEVGLEPIWKDGEGKLVPAIRLRLLGVSEKPLLVSTMDWDDAAFLIQALCEGLLRHMKKSRPISEANLLLMTDADTTAKRLAGALRTLHKVCVQAGELGIKVSIGKEKTVASE